LLSRVCSCAIEGIDAFVVDVEVDVVNGLPRFNMVGLPETAVRESRDRVQSAVKNCGYTFPMQRVVVNLAPADMKKDGTAFDLPIAVGLLISTGLIPQEAALSCMMAGELSLDGRLKPVRGVLPYAICARQQGYRGIIVPEENAAQAAMIGQIDVFPARTLSQVVDWLLGQGEMTPYVPPDDQEAGARRPDFDMDFADVQGQQFAKRALEIAAAGFHHILMTGPPGSGKSMLAKRLGTILPPLSYEEAIEVARIRSITGLTDQPDEWPPLRPFRSPHHTISDAGLVGGGVRPLPGEISLAHHGVLFLDELPEFSRNVLEVLRQPLEDGWVTLSRASAKATYPSRFMLAAAMNPCPCGFYSDPSGKCTCTAASIQRYQSKISGPLMDRIDLQVEVPRVEFKDLVSSRKEETSAVISERVALARQIQTRRFKDESITFNALMTGRQLKAYCPLSPDGETLLETAVDRMGFSARACHSMIRVARTIADLSGSEEIQTGHLAEAVGFRGFDRMRG
jgi:magnesium chelatase family protein